MPLKFAYICDLLDKLESIQTRDPPLLLPERKAAVASTINGWFKSHRVAIDAPDTDRTAILSTLLPERRADRVYFLQETGLVKILGRCLGLGRDRLQILSSWTPDHHQDLATLVHKLQSATDTGAFLLNITVEDIDRVLHKLASRCKFSGPSVRASLDNALTRLPDDLFRPLLSGLSARELKWFIRLVLKRYHPVQLDEGTILRSMHPLLPRLLQFQSTFSVALRILDNPLLANLRSSDERGFSAEVLRDITNVHLKPQVGVKIGRPDFHKARSIKHCLQITGKNRWAIEPKYDGEYCQLHIDLTKGKSCIQMFSKSGKDSTQDRRGMHEWIKAALRLGKPDCKFKTRCILEGEMVVYSDKDNSILDFHKIRKYVSRSGSYIGTENDSPRRPDEHLMMIFFDALLIDDDIVMAETYEVRRKRLRGLLDKYAGFCVTSDWGVIDFASMKPDRAARKVNKLFAKAIARRCEGLILKPGDGPYFALDRSTVAGKVIKLKKDYIPGLGDTADFAVIGARRSAAEMSKPESLNTRWTDFVIACILNKEEVLRYNAKPVVRILDVLSRPCIPVPDVHWICDRGQFCTEEPTLDGVQSKYDIVIEKPNPAMSVVFKKPFIVEVLGSSFDRPSAKNCYTLRHARILKIHRDRDLTDVVGFDDLQDMAVQAKKLPADLQQEEIAWLNKLQASHAPRGNPLSQSSTVTASTRSPGSAIPSPSRVDKLAPIPLVRIDTAELLPGEQRESQPRGKCGSLDVASLMTPPPSSPMVAIEGVVTPALSVSRKRKRGVDVLSLPAQHLETTRIVDAETSSVLNQGTQAARLLPGVVEPSLLLADDTNGSPKRPRTQQALGARGTESPRGNISNREKPIENVVTTPTRVSRALLRSSTLTGLIEDTSPVAPLPSIDHDRMRVVSKPIPRRQAAITILNTDDAPSAQKGNHPHLLAEISPTRCPNNNKPGHPFSSHIFYLSACIANTPYITENLLPSLYDPTTLESCFSHDDDIGSFHTHIIGSLSFWQRALVNIAAESFQQIGESQAYPGMQKAILVESRRRSQTRQMVEQVIRDMNLVHYDDGRERNETIQFWDWRILEEIVLLLHQVRKGRMDLGFLASEIEQSEKRWYLGYVSWSCVLECNVWNEGAFIPA